jgi:LemA protein
MNWLWVIVGILVLVVLWLIYAYNALVTLRQRVKEALSDIEVQAKRRYDLIPNLVSSVKGYAKHERGVFNEVTKARTEAMRATNPPQKARAENMLTEALKSVFAVAENYPNLKANENFLHLQQELSDTEDKLMASRRFYNSNARDLNTKIETFPTNLVARQLGFSKVEYFDAPDSETGPVKVSF